MKIIYFKKINKKSGFSLLEVVLAVAIFALSSFALSTMMIDSNISTKLSQERITAMLYAKGGIETAKKMRDISWSGLISTSTTFDNKYLRGITVTPDATSTKNVAVSVSWDLTTGRRATTTLYTILTKWASSTSP